MTPLSLRAKPLNVQSPRVWAVVDAADGVDRDIYLGRVIFLNKRSAVANILWLLLREDEAPA